MRHFAAITLSCLTFAAACASARRPSPFFDDEQYLRFGVDPVAEAEAVTHEHAAQGRSLARRLLGQHFTALGFGVRDERTAVRVVSKRGIVLALDEEQRRQGDEERHPVTLVAPPIEHTHDADRDGFEELFVRVGPRGDSCLRVYRARDTGELDEVAVMITALGQSRCPDDVADEDGDGRAELYASFVLAEPHPGQSRHSLATLRVPAFAKDHRFAIDANPDSLARHLAREREQRRALVAEARAVADLPWALALGLELAAIEAVVGAPLDQAQAAFDAVVAGLALPPPQLSLMLSARERVAGFYATPDSPAPASADKNPAP